jgi:hypothetical protein
MIMRMGTPPDTHELRRRQPLLDAWLEAMNRLGGPSNRITTVRMQSSDRVIVHPEPMWQ